MRHPLHPALVHFPVACWSLATAADLASVLFGTPAWHLAGIMLAIGLVMSIPALLAGMYELTRVAEESPAWRTIYLHMGAMSAALLLYAVSLFARLDRTTLLEPDSLAIACSVCGFIALALGGWFGGKLVYVHGLGR
ncbi:MAG TPA: DUF2231 domain-containing protein [Rudaea sp.]|nr:DUF2231 domain-containing protein [Rudaea sp.]